MPPEEIGRIWVFPPLKREDREWGTAVVSRELDHDRVAVYTARSVIVVRGKERGQGRVEVEEVGESPTAVVHEVIRGVQERTGEPDPPVEVDPALWFRKDDDEPAAEG